MSACVGEVLKLKDNKNSPADQLNFLIKIHW